MPRHEVQFDVPWRPLERADVVFTVRVDGQALGELHVSKGALDWKPRYQQHYRRLTWSQFDQLAQREGNRVDRPRAGSHSNIDLSE